MLGVDPMDPLALDLDVAVAMRGASADSEEANRDDDAVDAHEMTDEVRV